MQIQPVISSHPCKRINFSSNDKFKQSNKSSITFKETLDVAMAFGIFANMGYLSDFKNGTKMERVGKAAIITAFISDFIYSMYKRFN